MEPRIATLSLPIEGMTCASCVARVEKALLKIDGVESASVNLATEKASVRVSAGDAGMLGKLKTAVEEAGYTLVLPASEPAAGMAPESEHARSAERKEHEYGLLKRDFAISASFGAFIMGASMLSMTAWWMRTEPVSIGTLNTILFLAASVVMFIPGKRFFRAAFTIARHGQADMNTLVATGTGVAYVFSSVVTLFPQALPVHVHNVYFDTASTIIALIVLGRMLEARAKLRTADAMKSLLKLQPRTARIKTPEGSERDVDAASLAVDDVIIVRPGEKIPVDGVVIAGSTSV
ncbi:MAG TPA: cation transporter, partial [Bacteroidota bacterium]|nr:cation transporter [Bacteroidota bacterium]